MVQLPIKTDDLATIPQWKLWLLIGSSGVATLMLIAACVAPTHKEPKAIAPAILGVGTTGIFTFGVFTMKRNYPRYSASEYVRVNNTKALILDNLITEVDAPSFKAQIGGCCESSGMATMTTESSASDWGETEDQQGVTPFDWIDFRTNRDAYPHIGIAGKSGGGKSWLAEYLASCFDGIVVAVSPHWKKGGFTSADLVVGWGRNYGTVEDYEQYKHLSFAEILTGKYNISACAFLVALYHEMNRRYQIDEDQNFVGDSEPEIVAILDEFNAWANTEGLKDFTFKLLREARKVKIRLIPLVQGTEVKAMGCEGEGQIREQLTWVLIANKATSYAKKNLDSAKKGTQAYNEALDVFRYISTVKYPAFVGDLGADSIVVPAEIPDLSEWKKNYPSKANLAGWGGSTEKPVATERQDPRERLEALLSLECSQSVASSYTESYTAEECPSCGSHNVKWLSRNAGRKQCKECNKTWSVKN